MILLWPALLWAQGPGKPTSVVVNARGASYFTGTVRNAASCSSADVQAAIDAAADRDTVNIPSCSETDWSTTVTVNKAIQIRGQGEANTTIGDNLSKGSNSNCDPPHASMLTWTLNGSKFARLTALTIKAVTGINPFGCDGYPTVLFTGTAQFNGSSASGVRVDHVTFTNLQTTGVQFTGSLTGLVDHATCSYDSKNCFRVYHGQWAGSDWADGSWTAAIDWGGYNAMYFEDSSCTDTTGTNHTSCIDNYEGARAVFRHNTLNNDSWVVHGTDSHQRGRSARKTEVYSNTYNIDVNQNMADTGWCRGGGCMVFDNALIGRLDSAMISVLTCRVGTACGGGGPNYPPWGPCDNTAVWDGNTGGVGYRCLDQPGAGTSVDLGGMSTPSNVAAQNTLEPIYIWMNKKDGAYRNDVHNAQAGITVSDRDYYVGASGTQTSNSSPFNGTTGVGWGTTARKPTSCTDGTGYFDTDVNALYTCISNAWVLKYTPYQYPHPLQTYGN